MNRKVSVELTESGLNAMSNIFTYLNIQFSLDLEKILLGETLNGRELELAIL